MMISPEGLAAIMVAFTGLVGVLTKFWSDRLQAVASDRREAGKNQQNAIEMGVAFLERQLARLAETAEKDRQAADRERERRVAVEEERDRKQAEMMHKLTVLEDRMGRVLRIVDAAPEILSQRCPHHDTDCPGLDLARSLREAARGDSPKEG